MTDHDSLTGGGLTVATREAVALEVLRAARLERWVAAARATGNGDLVDAVLEATSDPVHEVILVRKAIMKDQDASAVQARAIEFQIRQAMFAKARDDWAGERDETRGWRDPLRALFPFTNMWEL